LVSPVFIVQVCSWICSVCLLFSVLCVIRLVSSCFVQHAAVQHFI
jgi:hypothetical protein